MHRAKWSVFASMSIAGALWACGGDGTSTVRLGLTGEGGQAMGRDARNTQVEVSSARAYVRHIELQLPSDSNCQEQGNDDRRVERSCGDESKVRINGPFVVDLISGEATPPLPALQIPPGNYTRVDVRFDEAAPDEGVVDAADPLARRTMLAAGRLEDGTPYDLSLAFDEDARFEDPAGLAIPEEVGALLLWLDVSAWFTALPLAECRQDGDLEMVNDRLQLAEGRGSCSDVENHLKEQIKRSGQLDRDD